MAEKLLKAQPSEAEKLGGLDPDVAEAAALAHDLGHPPFGHIAEKGLNRLAKAEGLDDGFEGNTQSFRIVGSLAVGDALSEEQTPVCGINLTRATLNAILKYPWPHGGNPEKPKKWGVYSSERGLFSWVRKRVQMLVACGVRADGSRQLLAFLRSQGESQATWEGFLNHLYARGLTGQNLLLIVTDGCPGLAAALRTVYPQVRHQRCWVHKMRNILEKVRRRDYEGAKADAQAIYRAEGAGVSPLPGLLAERLSGDREATGA